eukprot:TRINITY_DN56888_c0_g1_i1.p1 TRINITY_DN56888_c0_g1~~TRINITY_DN56888_c0_g1_i1.p1  ORF type:complete len:180 (-),score=29.42 TRINITY_DN56888_c0_g1_i1:23-562(-)
MGCSNAKGQAESPSHRVSKPGLSFTELGAAPADSTADSCARGAVDAADVVLTFLKGTSGNKVQAAIEMLDTGEHLIQPDESICSVSAGSSSNGDSEARQEHQERHEKSLDEFLNRVQLDPGAVKDDIKKRRQRDKDKAQLGLGSSNESSEGTAGSQISNLFTPGEWDDASDSGWSTVSQ